MIFLVAPGFECNVSFLFLVLRTIAADIRKQVTRDYGSPQLTKKRGGAHHPVSHPVFDMPLSEACRFEVVINKFYKKRIGVLVLGLNMKTMQAKSY